MTRIQNPLLGLSRESLYIISDSFCAEHGFNDKVDLFRRAAVLAQNPNDYESLPELTEEDKFWVKREYTRKLTTYNQAVADGSDKWSQTPALYYLVFVCSIGSAIHGWGEFESHIPYPVLTLR